LNVWLGANGGYFNGNNLRYNAMAGLGLHFVKSEIHYALIKAQIN
jgi:hypothetical protein